MLGFTWLDFLFLVVAGGILLYLFVQEKYTYFKKRGIAHDKPVFLFGNLWKVVTLAENLTQTVTKLYQSHPGAKVVGMYRGLRPVYIPRDPDLVNRIVVREFSSFHDRGVQIDERTNPMEGHLFNMTGNKWKTLRNKLTPTFTSGKLKGMYSIMDTCMEELITYLETVVDEEIEIKDILCRLTTDVIGTCAFGLEPQAIKDPDCEFRQMGKRVFKPSNTQRLKFLARFLFPAVFKFFKIRSVDTDMESFFFNMTTQNFDHRLKNNIRRNDFVQLLLELREKGEVKTDPIEIQDEDNAYLYSSEVGRQIYEGEEKLVLDDNLLTAQAFVFFIAGFETSATGLSFIVYLLSKHQDVQNKLRHEITEVKKKFGSFTYDALKAMIYLEACIKEGLRIYPPVGALVRKCNKTLTAEDGTVLEEGSTILIPVHAIQNDPLYFPEPESFKPERFLVSSPATGTYLPFGDGPRVCIAQRFALVEMKLALAKVIEKIRIETCPKMAEFEPIKMDPGAFITAPIGGIFVRLRSLTD